MAGGGPDHQGERGFYFLHGFRVDRGTGTATLEAKLLQKLATMREEVLYVIFIDLQKAYDALDRDRCLEILEGYGVGPRARRILCTGVVCGWYHKQGSTTGRSSRDSRGVMKGDYLYSTILNVVVDAVV